jgi:hypothetical protein
MISSCGDRVCHMFLNGTIFCTLPKGHEGDHRSLDEDSLPYTWDNNAAEDRRCPVWCETYRCGLPKGHRGPHSWESTEEMKSKSVLDNVPVEDKAFPLNDQRDLTIVNYCKTCGNPIYGYDSLGPEDTILIKYSCECRSQPQFQDTIHSK